MAVDILGPANAANSVTTRPTDDRTFGVDNTWFKDCTSVTANDGTKVKSSWLNAVTGFARSLVRMNGNTLASVPVVTEDNADDMGARAVQHLVQRGQPSYARDTGAANTITVALSPAPAEYKEGMIVVVKIKTSNTGASSLNVNGLGAVMITHYDGSVLGKGDLTAGAIAAFAYDGAYFQLAWSQRQPGAPIYLQNNANWYVDATSGSDSYNGASAAVAGGGVGPFKTVNRAMSEVVKYNMNGYVQSIYVANGAYVEHVYIPGLNGSGILVLQGNHASPASVSIVGPPSSTAISINGAGGGANVQIDGFSLTSGTGAYVGDPMDCLGINNAVVNLGNMVFGSAVRAHIALGGGSTLSLDGSNSSVISIQGDAAFHMLSEFSATIRIPSIATSYPRLSIPLARNITCFAGADTGATIQVVYQSIAGAGNVNGQKYSVSTNANISVLGNGVNYLPGNSAGVTASGGQYT